MTVNVIIIMIFHQVKIKIEATSRRTEDYTYCG